MTATNHALTGAFIAVVFKQPALALPLAFLSHFVLDVLPHFGLRRADVFERNKRLITKVVLPIDLVVATGVFIGLGFILRTNVSNALITLSALVALSPDLAWVYRFFKEIKTREWKAGNRFTRFHQGIQWAEREWGIVVEILWAISAVAAIELVK